jgi:serine/threonine protein kinase
MSADEDARERAEQKTMLMPRRDQGVELRRGAQLEEFVIEKPLGVGGYSIVYLALDTKLDRRVALKEYLPGTIAARAPSGEVVPRLPRFDESYKKGLQSFINEARLLGSFDHAALVKVFRFWASNGTAYMAMPYYEGVTLKKWLHDLGAPPSERWLRALCEPLMQAVAVLHEHRTLHRDISPDNILMLYDRATANYLEQAPRPVLLDFGAARRVAAEATQQLTAILKTGYSPVEQYDTGAKERQGPWTDVYAICAVMYLATIGKVPPASVGRMVRDEMVPARVAGKGRYSQAFLRAIDAGLAVRPEQRPRNVAELMALFNRSEAELEPGAALDLDLPLTPAPAHAPAPSGPKPMPVVRREPPQWPWVLLGALLFVLVMGAVWLVLR